MSSLDPETLKARTREALEKARARLVRDCNFDPFAVMIFEDGRPEMLPFPGFLMENGRVKDVLFSFLGRFCKEHNAPGLIIVSDAWSLKQTPEQEKRMKDPAYFAEYVRIGQEQGIIALAAKGFGRAVEMITATGQSATFAYAVMQCYERVAADGVIPPTASARAGKLPKHSIRFLDEKVASSDEGFTAEGRMFSLYKPEPVRPPGQ